MTRFYASQTENLKVKVVRCLSLPEGGGCSGLEEPIRSYVSSLADARKKRVATAGGGRRVEDVDRFWVSRPVFGTSLPHGWSSITSGLEGRSRGGEALAALDVNRLQSHVEPNQPLPAKPIWMAIVFRYNNSDYPMLKRWDVYDKPFTAFIRDVIRPFVNLQDITKGYITDIWVKLEQVEYYLSHDEDIENFFRSRSEASGPIHVRMEVYQATRGHGLCINPD